MKFKRFTKPEFLRQIGRELLDTFFGRFRESLAAKGIELPGAGVDEEAYFQRLREIAMSPAEVPDELFEAMFMTEELANEHGLERLEKAAARAGIEIGANGEATPGEFALKVWLADAELLTRQHNEHRLARLSSFEYHGSTAGVRHPTRSPHPQPLSHAMGEGGVGLSPVEAEREQIGGTFAAPDAATLARMERDLDEWFSRHQRGAGMAHIEVYPMAEEFWFLVRHGDTVSRLARAEPGRTVLMHFRPAKDDVVVYSPERDELRIHAGTKGERELYRTTFGLRLFGDDQHFSVRKAFTLDPLRTLKAEALDTEGIPGLTRMVLRELEVAYGGEFNDVAIRKSEDFFASAEARGREAIPESGRLARAVFDAYFGDATKGRKVEVRPPNVLKLGRHCDAVAIQRWLSERGFRETLNGSTSPLTPLPDAERGTRGGISRVTPVVMP